MSVPIQDLPSCGLPHASETEWDVVVIGAGPAGALTAHEVAKRGCSVLLVDKASFPRRKVCGCYLNGSAITTLGKVGLHGLLSHLNAPTVNSVRLGIQNKTAELRLPDGAALGRETLDTALIQKAISQGVEFLPKTEAKLESATSDFREISLACDGSRLKARCKIAVIADGVSGHTLRDCGEIQYKTAPAARIGASAIADKFPHEMQRGKIYMAIQPTGYVGALVLEDGRLDIAGAFDPGALKADGPGKLAQSIVRQSGLPQFVGETELRWLGTSPLTRKPTAQAGHRFFLVGDASGYVEPFTGEGMSWALASAYAVTPLVVQSVESYSPELIKRWNNKHRTVFGARQRMCRWLTQGLRSPTLPSVAISVLSRLPFLATPFLYWLNRAPAK